MDLQRPKVKGKGSELKLLGNIVSFSITLWGKGESRAWWLNHKDLQLTMLKSFYYSTSDSNGKNNPYSSSRFNYNTVDGRGDIIGSLKKRNSMKIDIYIPPMPCENMFFLQFLLFSLPLG